MLRGADEIGLRKPVKAEFGGGMRSFSCEEDYIYENIENELYFFTSQVGCGGMRDVGQGCGDVGYRDVRMKGCGDMGCRDVGMWDTGMWG